jgi:predicted metalloprotease with PDZ domain
MRSRQKPYALLALSALLGVLGMLMFWAAARLQLPHPDVVYTVTPNPASGRVGIRVDLDGLPPGRVFFLAPEMDLSRETGPAAVPDFADREGVPAGPNLWWGRVSPWGRLSLSYEVTPRSGDSRHALLAGPRTFTVPLRCDARAALFDHRDRKRSGDGRVPGAARRIRVRFVLPPGWDAYTPWAESGTGEVEVPGGRFTRLRESFVALGDYLPHTFVAAGARVEMVTRGTDPRREERLVALARACLAAHAAAVGPSPHRRLLIITDHPFRGDQAAGETALNAVSLDLSRDPDAFASRSLARVVSHELFHLWNGGGVDLDAPELRWFTEGATEYFGLRALAATGRVAPLQMADDLAGSFDRLRGNPWADSSLAALGRGYDSEPLAWSATYAKGTLAAWALDLRLAGAGGLDSLLRELVREGRRPALAARLAQAGGGVAAGLLDSLSGRGFEAAVIAELAAHGLRLETRRADLLTLGFRFFRPGTTEIVDLDPQGPAARVGVREGDRVVEVGGRTVDDLAVLAEALADAAGGPVPVGLERRGQRLAVRIPPARAVVTRVVATPRAVMASRLPPPGELPR